MLSTRYIFDTSTWITWVKHYPRLVFPTLVNYHEKLINDDRIVSPTAVFDEIMRGNDEVVEWAKSHKKIFVKHTDSVITKATVILTDHPYLGRTRGMPDNADPYLIALASISNNLVSDTDHIIVSEENKLSSKKVPQVARRYKINTYNIIEMFCNEGWTF